ncbi:MAG: enoyl-CoA hydratase/isomerase family protein [Chloroflexi bacterium]|nr:enoyl-CoA hydratase/isomerase family protein [Chloroflexota bacterium]MCI0895720.1 enoyl-CoA hydratase/isomerase family protein [Chloroflexota bacterium]
MEYTNIKLDKENAVATIRLNRPDALNALSPDLLDELSDAVSAVAEDQAIKAMVVRGEGRAFCAGADLTFFDTAFGNPDEFSRYLKRFNSCLFQLEELPVPVIAVVHGFALAGGLELMLACDLALAADDARIGDQHINFGLIPGGGSTQRLPRRIGMQRAMELLTTGRWLSGSEAAEWGLVLRAVAADDLDKELEALLAPLRIKSRPGLGWIKSVARRGRELPLVDGIALESQAFVQYMTTSDHPKQGIQAFKEKRQPEF